MKKLSIITLLLIGSSGFTQTNKFLSNLYTTPLHQNQHFINFNNFSSFFSSGIADKEFIPYQVDQDLLNATVFFMFNKYRKKRHRQEVDFSEQLELTAFNFIKQFNTFKFRKLKNNNAKVSKILPFVFKKLDVKMGISKGLVSMPQVVDYKFGKKIYYDKEDTETDLQLFYGRKSDSDEEEKGEIKKPIPPYTYYSFAESLVKDFFLGFSGRFARSKSYSIGACFVEVDEKSFYKKKVPKAKAIMILSGKRTGQVVVKK